jgi:DNA-binding GntR family transcriptional regulator
MRPEEIASALRSAVRERAFRPGQPLNQDELARRYGVSRIPVREALRTLVGEGLIIMKPGLGAIVRELKAEEVNELYGLRLQLEPPLAQDIVQHVRRRDVEDLSGLLSAADALGQEHFEEWSNLSYRFHRRLYELSERRHTVRLVVQVLNLVEPYARVHAHVLGSRTRVQVERAETLEALRAGEASRLSQLLALSIETARAQLVESMVEQASNISIIGWQEDL